MKLLPDQLLQDYQNGYLREDILEQAMINIARHQATAQSDRVREWLIIALLIAAGIALYWISPRDRSSPSPQKVPPQKVEAPHLLDDSPPGSYDFTVLDRSGRTQNIPIPAPCNGTIVKVWFQGKTGDLQSGWGAGNVIDLACDKSPYGWRMAHFQEVWVKSGQAIVSGMAIAGQGCTGRCSGDHVHAQIHSLPSWQRIEERSITAPIVDRYLKQIQTGQ